MSEDTYTQEVAEQEKKKAEYNAIPVISYAQLKAVFDKWMIVVDEGVIKFIACVIIANHKLDSDPVWAFLVAASGGGKTALIDCLLKVPEYYSLSQLTPNTLLSGYKSKDKEPSLLLQLGSGRTIGFKDFTSILDGNKDAFKEIMGQFRDMYDGHMVKRLGTGDEIPWNGKIGFLAGSTPMIEQRMSIIGAMGERFMSYKIKQPKNKEVKAKIRSNVGKEKQGKEEMQIAMAGYLKGIAFPDELPTLPEEIDKLVDSMADFIALSRSVVMRSYDSKKEIEYIPPSEMSTRVYKQLYNIALTLYVMNGKEWQPEDTYILKNLAVSSVHSLRYNLIKEIQKYTTKVKTSTLAVILGYPTTTTRRYLEDLTAISMDDGMIKILVRTHQGVGKPDLWQLTPVMIEMLKDMGDYIEPHKADDDFDQDEKDIPVGVTGNGHAEVEQDREKELDEIEAGMSKEEKEAVGLSTDVDKN